MLTRVQSKHANLVMNRRLIHALPPIYGFDAWSMLGLFV
jgi:hypothetical protein